MKKMRRRGSVRESVRERGRERERARVREWEGNKEWGKREEKERDFDLIMYISVGKRKGDKGMSLYQRR